MRTVFEMWAVWLIIAVVVACAYGGYKRVGYYSGYAYDVLRLKEADAPDLTAYASYIRLIVALGPDTWGIGRYRTDGLGLVWSVGGLMGNSGGAKRGC